MERDGLLQRRVYLEVPPRVEYQLTPRGKTLEPVFDAMCAWGTGQLRTGFADLVESASRCRCNALACQPETKVGSRHVERRSQGRRR